MQSFKLIKQIDALLAYQVMPGGKKMKKTTFAALLSVVVLGIVAAGTASAFGLGRGLFAQGDYKSYVDAMEEKGIEPMSEALYNELVEHREQMETHRLQMKESRAKAMAAIGAGDYDAWLAAISEMPNAEEMTEKITEANFDLLVQMHEAREDGDWETAEELAGQLSLDMPFGQGKGMGGMGNQGMGRMSGAKQGTVGRMQGRMSGGCTQ